MLITHSPILVERYYGRAVEVLYPKRPQWNLKWILRSALNSSIFEKTPRIYNSNVVSLCVFLYLDCLWHVQFLLRFLKMTLPQGKQRRLAWNPHQMRMFASSSGRNIGDQNKLFLHFSWGQLNFPGNCLSWIIFKEIHAQLHIRAVRNYSERMFSDLSKHINFC